MPLGQLLEEIPRFPGNWHKVKTFICIGKDGPRCYIKEQLLEIISYAGHKGIASNEVVTMLQEMCNKNPKK